MPIKTINGEDIAGLMDRGTLTSSDDLNAVTSPGIYWYGFASAPANAPTSSANARVLVVKSLTADNNGAAFQICIADNVIYYRSHESATAGSWSAWHSSKEFLATRDTVTSSDDLNNLQIPGIYTWLNGSIPQNAPEGVGDARMLLIKSPTLSNMSMMWQMTVHQGILYYRGKTAAASNYGPWHSTSGDIASALEGYLGYVTTLTASDDMDEIGKPGVYYYDRLNRPDNAPTKNAMRPLVVKSATESNHTTEYQLGMGGGTLFYRQYGTGELADDPRFDWKSIDVASPIYQTEELPYNAVLYHQKWSGLLNSRYLRRVNLGNVDGDSSLPMYAYEFSPQRDFVGLTPGGSGSSSQSFDWTNALYKRPKALIIGGVHGNEKCTPMDIYAIVRKLLTRQYNDIACLFDWYFIPLVNPWGYSHARLDAEGKVIYDNSGETASIVECSESVNAGIRNNSHGQNINRDWSDVLYEADGVSYGFQTPELQLIKDYVLGIKPDLFIDAHQNHANRSASTNPVVAHAGAAIDESNTDSGYVEKMRKIYRHLDVANADTDEIALMWASNFANSYQAFRIWPTIRASTSEHYFSGVTALNGSTVIGNTEHLDICTDYSICSETSEIAYTYSETSDWYNPVACTLSCTYLWNIIKRMAEFF